MISRTVRPLWMMGLVAALSVPVAASASSLLETFVQTCTGREPTCQGSILQQATGSLTDEQIRVVPAGFGATPDLPGPFGGTIPGSPGTQGSYDAIASASASYGVLGTRARVVLDDYPVGSFEPSPYSPGYGGPTAAAHAWARFSDDITVTVPGGGAAEAYLRMTIAVSRSVTNSTPFVPDGAWGIVSLFRSSGATYFMDSKYFFDVGSSAEAFKIQVVLGETFQFSVEMQSIVRLYDAPDSQQWTATSSTYDFSGDADLAHTAVITRVQFFSDPDLQHELTGLTVHAASGTEYPVLASIPEPGIGAMLVVGLAVVGCAGLRRPVVLRSSV